MKDFLCRILLFSVLALALTLSIIGMRLRIGERAAARAFTPSPDTSTIVISDSHGQYGFSTEDWPGLQNFSEHSICYWQVLIRLEWIMKQYKTGSIRHAIFTLSTHSFYKLGCSKGEREQFTENLPLTLWYLDDWPYEVFPLEIGELLLDPMTAFRTKGFCPPPSKKQSGSLFETRSDLVFVDAALQRHYLQKPYHAPDMTEVDARKAIFEKILSICDAHGIRPVFVTTPVHGSYRERCPSEARHMLKSFQSWLRSKGCLVLDYWDLPLDDSAFYDGDHLSRKGRIAFTKMIRDEVLGALPGSK